MLESLILPALLPAVGDGLKALWGKLFGGAKPATVDDQVKLMSAENDRLKAIAEVDKPYGEISKWVSNLRASFRYIAAGAIILFAFVTVVMFFYVSTTNPSNGNIPVLSGLVDLMLQMASSVFAFMFGDRLYMSLKGWTNKK